MATGTIRSKTEQDSENQGDWTCDATETVDQASSDSRGESHSSPSLLHMIVMLTAVIFPFLGFLAAIVSAWIIGWNSGLYLGMLLVGWILTGTGITVGFHRLLTHRAFETSRWVRAFWMATGSLAVQGSPLTWCATHRKHHELSDISGDPHSPLLHGDGGWNAVKGFVHSHIGWLFTPLASYEEQQRYIPDLLKEPMLVWVDRIYHFWVLASLAAPALIGGLITFSWKGALLGFIWGGLARIFLVHHITWSINSICHIFGRTEYEAGDHSRNNFICGVLGHGEGWHNNHHAFPTSARHGLKWWQFDASWLIIRGMELVGLAWDVRLPSERAMAAKRLE